MSLLDDMEARDALWTKRIRQAIGEDVERIAAGVDFGKATAAKRGRNPRRPYVPVIQLRSDGEQLGGIGSARTQQLKGLAYATRDEAIARAQRQLEANRARFVKDLFRPGSRAAREYWGLPRDPVARPTMAPDTDRQDGGSFMAPARPAGAQFHECEKCQGTGEIDNDDCPDCEGTGQWFE